MSVSLDVQHLSKSFGSLEVIKDCSLYVADGSVTGLIGPNGAGKSTLFNLIAGSLAPDSGTIHLGGEDITGLKPDQLFHMGLLRTFQIAHEFSNLTVLENLMVVPADQSGEDLVSAWFRPLLVHRQEKDVLSRANDVIDFLKLSHVKNERAGNLSGGQKKLLELGRTMMVESRIVLLDEIAAGVNRTLLNDLAANIERLNREFDYTFFVIEHDMDLIARLCDPVIVLIQGSVMTQGTIEEVKADDRVIEAYFGGSPQAARQATQ